MSNNPITLDATMSEEQYISMSVSRDSDEGQIIDGNMVLDLCNVSNGCFGSPTLSDAELLSDVENRAVTSNATTTAAYGAAGSNSGARGVKNPSNNDLSEALLMSEDDVMMLSNGDPAKLGQVLPSTKGLLSRLRKLNLREKLEVTIWNQRFWPVLPLFVKAEMNAPLTVVEEITTWIVLISWLQVVVLGNPVSLIVGGVALFTSLTVLHFWYGFTRYHSLESDWYNDMMFGKALDENFELIRDICSYQCHGDGERRKQIGAIVVTAPFTLVNHLCFVPFYILSEIYHLICGGRNSNPTTADNTTTEAPHSPTVALMGGVFLANILLTTLWLYGGPVLMTLVAITFVTNQRLYNALLFRRSFEGFVTSFVFGNFCIGETTPTVESPLEGDIVAETDPREMVDDLNGLKKKRSWTSKVKKTARWITEKTKARLAARRKNRLNRTNSKQASVQQQGVKNEEEDDIELGRMPDAIAIHRSDSLFDGLEDSGVPPVSSPTEGGMTSEVAFVPLIDQVPATATTDISNPYSLLPNKRDTPSKRSSSGISAKTLAKKAMGMLDGSRSNRGSTTDEHSMEELPFDVVQDQDRITRIHVLASDSAPEPTPTSAPKNPSEDLIADNKTESNSIENPANLSATISIPIVEQSTEPPTNHARSEKLKLSRKLFGPKFHVTVTTEDGHAQARPDDKHKQDEEETEPEPVDESVEIADVINVKSYLRKVAKEQKGQTRTLPLMYNKRKVGVDPLDPSKDNKRNKKDLEKMTEESVQPIDESIEISEVVNIKSITRKMAKNAANNKHKNVEPSNIDPEPIDESVEVSENVILKPDPSNKGKNDVRMRGGALLSRVFKRGGGTDEAGAKETTVDDNVNETRDGGASAEFQKEMEANATATRDDYHMSTLDSKVASPKLAMDAIGGILQSSDSVSAASKISSKSKNKHSSSKVPPSDESVLMWSESQSMSTYSASMHDDYDDDEMESMQLTEAMDFLGEMLCLEGPKRHKAPLILSGHDDGNSMGGSTLDSRDLSPTDVLSGEASRDGSREGEPQEVLEDDVIETTIESTMRNAEEGTPVHPSEPIAKKKRGGIKKFFPRVKNSIKVEKLDEKSKNDPELVKKWIIDQTKTLRTRSKALNSVWNRAIIQLRQKKEANQSKADGENTNLHHMSELEGITLDNDDKSVVPVERAPKPKFHVVFDAKTLEQEEIKRKQQELAKKQELVRKEEEAAIEAQATAAADSFYDQLMLIWANDYVKETPTPQLPTRELQHINALADDMSASDGSTLSSMASLMSQVPPRNLIEFVEQKIEQEILFSRLCVGDSVYSGMKCDAGFGYLVDNDSSGFMANLCGIKT